MPTVKPPLSAFAAYDEIILSSIYPRRLFYPQHFAPLLTYQTHPLNWFRSLSDRNQLLIRVTLTLISLLFDMTFLGIFILSPDFWFILTAFWILNSYINNANLCHLFPSLLIF